jgi:LPS sulfotransferase NodH
MWDQLRDAATQFATLPGLGGARPSDVLAAAFPNVHYVWLTRRDKVRQGISYYRAMETKIWRSTDVPTVPPVDPPFNYEAINSLVQLATWEDQAWEDYFRQNAIDPCVVVYEELQLAPITVARQVLSYLGVLPSIQLQEGSWQNQRQADAITDDWVERYKACRHGSQ